jgi:hypothetical protein
MLVPHHAGRTTQVARFWWRRSAERVGPPGGGDPRCAGWRRHIRIPPPGGLPTNSTPRLRNRR